MNLADPSWIQYLIAIGVSILFLIQHSLGRKVEAIKHEVTPNSGSSTKDAVNRTEDNTRETLTKQDDTKLLLESILEQLKGFKKDIETLYEIDRVDTAKAGEVHKALWDEIVRLRNRKWFSWRNS